MATRADAIARVREHLHSGAFLGELGRRVGYRTESQNPGSGEALRAYLVEDLQPAFAALDFSTRLIESPTGKGPYLLADYREDAALPTVLTYTLISEVFAEQLACRSDIADSFWDGTIATRFLKPIGITGQFTSEMLGRWLLGFGAFSLPLLLCTPLLGVNPLPAGVRAGCLFLLSLLLAVSVGLALEFIFAAIAIGAGEVFSLVTQPLSPNASNAPHKTGNT